MVLAVWVNGSAIVVLVMKKNIFISSELCLLKYSIRVFLKENTLIYSILLFIHYKQCCFQKHLASVIGTTAHYDTMSFAGLVDKFLLAFHVHMYRLPISFPTDLYIVVQSISIIASFPSFIFFFPAQLISSSSNMTGSFQSVNFNEFRDSGFLV